MDLRHISSKSSTSVVLALFLSLLLVSPLAASQARGRSQQTAPSAPAAADGSLLHGTPAYDSGWVDLVPDAWIDLAHNLGGDPDDYVVDLQFWDRSAGSSSAGVNNWLYGTDVTSQGSGARWSSLTATNISITAGVGDPYVDAIRVRIWVVPRASYDSGWQDVDRGQDKVFWHSLGGNPDDYVVDLQFKNTVNTAVGVHQQYYGGQRLDGHTKDGAFWHSLTTSSIKVHRYFDAGTIHEVRVRIWRRPNPAYDSGWQPINLQLSLDHYLGGPWNDTVVDLQFKDSGDGYGVNQFGYGGDTVFTSPTEYHGAAWTHLTGSGIEIHRGADDLAADRVRVRIWASRRPKYDSDWFDLGRPGFRTLDHHLGGIADAYKLELQFRDTAAGGLGVNQAYAGGEYWWDYAASAFVSQGVWWRSLTDESVFVYRHAGDPGAGQARLRLWIAPEAEYDSGWRDIEGTLVFNHDLQIAAHRLVVDLQFLDDDGASPSGVNNHSYGGDTFFGGGVSLVARGAYWHDLTYDSISVTRLKDAGNVDKVRVRIWSNSRHNYDSTWQDLGSLLPLNHNLGADAGEMVVDLQFQDAASPDPHQRSYGGNSLNGFGSFRQYGARWQNLTDTSIEVERLPDDTFADRARVRIWRTGVGYEVFLPLIVRR